MRNPNKVFEAYEKMDEEIKEKNLSSWKLEFWIQKMPKSFPMRSKRRPMVF
jgi:hypothetical protein